MPLWAAGDGLWALASALMLIGSVLFVGSLFGNPALPGPPEQDQYGKACTRGLRHYPPPHDVGLCPVGAGPSAG